MSPSPPRKALGAQAERAAAKLLKAQGYTLIARNFSTKVGEIDIIAADGGTLCFIEVRARARADFAAPYASVTRRKQARIRSAASAYLTAKRLHDRLCRFDIVSLVADAQQKSGWSAELIRDAF